MEHTKPAESHNVTAPLGRNKRRAQEVLNAAASVFAEKGFSAATTQDIADVLGMRQASLYYYLDSKDSALEKVCTVGVMAMLKDAEAVVSANASNAVKLQCLIVAHLEMMRHRAAFMRVFLHERHHLRDERRRRVRRLSNRIETIFIEVFEQGIRAGEFRGDLEARIAALLVLGMLNTATRWYDKSHAVSIEGLADHLTRLVTDGVCGVAAIDTKSKGLDSMASEAPSQCLDE